MSENGLDQHGIAILDDYRENYPLYQKLQEVVVDILTKSAAKSGIQLTAMESRIKTEKSLIGKLKRKGNKYGTLKDITDIFGARLIAYYNEDVDRLASLAENLFEIDWSNSVDKRKRQDTSSFGYSSLHYICRLPKKTYDNYIYPGISELPFELQMRTALQHVWSAIQHDIGYKSEIETPAEYHRQLSRLAGLMELADDEFSRIRRSVTDYRRKIKSLFINGQLEEIPIDSDTFPSYLELRPFDELNRRIASINQAEFESASLEAYLPVLLKIGLRTLADVQEMLKDDSEDAYQLALIALGATDIDILSETIGLQNLCIVHYLKTGAGELGVKHIFDIINGEKESNSMMAETIMEQARRLSFMNK